VPTGTSVATSDGVEWPLLKLARLLAPGVEPASTTYELAASPLDGAVHVSVTVLPLTEAARFDGVFGAESAATPPTCARPPDALHPGAARQFHGTLAGATEPAPATIENAPGPLSVRVEGSTGFGWLPHAFNTLNPTLMTIADEMRRD
jgi:hypothetical protein